MNNIINIDSQIDLYELLEINSNSSDEQIKKAWKKLALKYHPDKNKSPEATQKFTDINNAYESITKPQIGPPNGPPCGPSGHDIFEMFRNQSTMFHTPFHASFNPNVQTIQRSIHIINGQVIETIVERQNNKIKTTKKINGQIVSETIT